MKKQRQNYEEIIVLWSTFEKNSHKNGMCTSQNVNEMEWDLIEPGKVHIFEKVTSIEFKIFSVIFYASTFSVLFEKWLEPN